MLYLYLTYIDDKNAKTLFEKIYNSYRKQMMITAVSILHNTADAEDVVHEVFLKIAIRHMDMMQSLENETDRRNYLLKAVQNTALNWHKKKSRIQPLEKDDTLFYHTSNIGNDVFVDYICQKMDRLVYCQKKRSWNMVNTVKKRVAIIAVVILALFTTACSVEEVREGFIRWCVDVYEGFNHMFFEGDTTKEITHRYELTVVPEGFVEVERDESQTNRVIGYEHESGEYGKYGKYGKYIEFLQYVTDFVVNYFEIKNDTSYDLLKYSEENLNKRVISFDLERNGINYYFELDI